MRPFGKLAHQDLKSALCRADQERLAAQDVIYSMAYNEDEKIGEILDRIGETHPAHAAYEATWKVYLELRYELASARKRSQGAEHCAVVVFGAPQGS